MILDMGFLTPTASQVQEQALSDLYTMFKCNKDQNILAENLQSSLMMIAGIRDESQEIDNDINNTKWMMAGVYEEQTGLFFFREGEHKCVAAHFQIMQVNRLQQKKALKYQNKLNEDPKFEPKISNKSKKLAENYRKKNQQSGGGPVDIIDLLHNPETIKLKEQKLELMRKAKIDKENEELTYKPKVNSKMNQTLTINHTEGDHLIDLYKKSKIKDK